MRLIITITIVILYNYQNNLSSLNYRIISFKFPRTQRNHRSGNKQRSDPKGFWCLRVGCRPGADRFQVISRDYSSLMKGQGTGAEGTRRSIMIKSPVNNLVLTNHQMKFKIRKNRVIC